MGNQNYLFYTAGGRCALPGSLSGKLLAGCLASCGLASSLLGTCHIADVEGEWWEALWRFQRQELRFELVEDSGAVSTDLDRTARGRRPDHPRTAAK